jgi:hypothetical protein
VATVHSYLAFAKIKKHHVLAHQFATAITKVKQSEYYQQRQQYYQSLQSKANSTIEVPLFP